MPRLFRDVVWNPQEGLAAYRNMTAADFDLVRTAFEKKKKLVRLLHEAGARLHLGTDTQQPFVAPGLAPQQEMRLFVESGIPAADVWRLATVEAGQSLGLAQLGTIAPGCFPADLLIFAKDPTADLAALDLLQAVVAQGRLYPKADIDAKVAEYRVHYSGFVFDQLSTMLGRCRTAQLPPPSTSSWLRDRRRGLLGEASRARWRLLASGALHEGCVASCRSLRRDGARPGPILPPNPPRGRRCEGRPRAGAGGRRVALDG
jgi:hypothetical protein